MKAIAVAAALLSLVVFVPAGGGSSLEQGQPEQTDWRALYVDEHGKRLAEHARRLKLRARAVRLERSRNFYRAALRHRPSSVEAIRLAATVYHVSAPWMLGRCSCESTGGHGLDAGAHNRRSGAAGLCQIIPSTWRSTPFRSFSPFSPYANALAAGWMMGPARRAGEWDCA